MNIITGYRNEPHVTSQQLRNTYISIFGSDAKILKGVGSEMAATIISANEIDIADGMVSCQGCTAEIPRGTVESMVIENGSQGMMRTDLIVVRYTKNAGTGVETMELAVIKGTPASSNPQRPSHTSGTISEGDTLVEFPLYDVNINGISITSVTRLVDIAGITSSLTAVNNKIGNTAMGTVATTITGAIKELVSKIGAVAMGTTATTLTGAIKELKTALTTLQTHDSNQGMQFIPVALGTFNFNSAGAAEGTVNVASKVPSAHTLASVIPRTTGTYSAYFYACQIDGSNVHFQIMRATGETTSCSPTVTIICKRNL